MAWNANPMATLRWASSLLAADRRRIAIRRGPMVYCAEAVDNRGSVGDIELPDDAVLRAEFRKDLLGGVAVITGDARRVRRDAEGSSLGRERARLVLVPYHYSASWP